MIQQTLNQLEAVRELLERADADGASHVTQRQIGAILVALGTLTDIVERLACDVRAVADQHE